MTFIQCFIFILFTITAIVSDVHSSQLNKLVMNSVASKEVSTNSGICFQEARCEPIHNATCFGTALPYSSTSFALAEDSVSPLEIQDNLSLWKSLRAIPRCWAVVQPLLCAIYMPKCENSTLSLPSQEMCRITRWPCRAVEAKHGWPMFLRCENKEMFPSGCRNPLQEVKFNTSTKCILPLVETDNPDSWYDGVEGCGLQCQNPLFTAQEHEDIHSFIKVMASICFAANFLIVLTFCISWKVANRYPSVIIFYINICLSCASIGWLIQFFSGAREAIVCLPDGTVRQKQPRSGEYFCTITFILIYYFVMAALVWFVILTYAWHVFFKQSGVPKDVVKKKKAYFHLSAWCIPLVLTTIVMAMQEVDGDSMSGICFVGYANLNMRIGFLLVPVGVTTLIGGFFLANGIYTLLEVNSNEVTNGRGKKEIRRMILKIGIRSLFVLISVLCTFACHGYDFMYKKDFEGYLREYIVCLATASSSPNSNSCILNERPSISVKQLHFMSFFGFSIAMASLACCRATLETWRRFLYKLCGPPEQDALAIKRHKLIAKAFQHRNELNQGRFSFSWNSTHEDPIGMNFDVNSIASREISSTWASALPQFLNRRNAIATALGMKHYSSASDVSGMQMSVDSFQQQNLDSLSLQISEQEYARVLRHQRRRTRKERKRFLRANRMAPWFPRSRRGSDTSLQSSVLAASVAAARVAAAKVTKATSTGDLNFGPMPCPTRPPTSYVVNRQLTQRPAIPNLPFTHGMTDNSHHLNIANRKKAPESGYLNGPSTTSGTNVAGGATSQTPYTPLYHPNYGYLQQGYMYPGMNSMFPGYHPMANLGTGMNPYAMLSYMHYGQFQNHMMGDQSSQHPHLIPLNPTVDSASETDYLPIILSDSEFTDGGRRSLDEAQFSAQRLIQSQGCRPFSQQQQQTELPFPRNIITPVFLPTETEQDYDVGLLFDTKSPHSEVPPPSPVDSEDFQCNVKEGMRKSNSRQSV